MFKLGDIIETKKTHVCGNNKWEIIRFGADIKIKCVGCGRIIMMPKYELDKKIKVSKTVDK